MKINIKGSLVHAIVGFSLGKLIISHQALHLVTFLFCLQYMVIDKRESSRKHLWSHILKIKRGKWVSILPMCLEVQ